MSILMIATHTTTPTLKILRQMALARLRPLQYLLDSPIKIHYHILRKSIAFPLHLR